MTTNSPRPYWHVDAKWVLGLFLIIALAGTLWLFFMTRVTNRQNAVELGSLALATFFSREEGLDGSESIEKLKEQVGNQSDDVIRPLPEIPAITITRQQLETLPPRELRLTIFRQMIEPLYDNGVEATAQRFTNDPAAQEKLAKDAFLLKYLTKSFHDQLLRWLTGLVVVTVLLLAGFVYFSFGWGRLGNPGMLFVITGLPGTVMGMLMTYPPTDGDGGLLKSVPEEVTRELGRLLLTSHAVVFGVGLVLLLIALVGSLVSRVRRRQAVAR